MTDKAYRLADEGLFLSIVPDALKKLPALRATVIYGDGSTSERDLVSIAVRRKARKAETEQHVWADRVTGTLFNQATGACLSSSRIRLARPPVPRTKHSRAHTTA